MLSLTRFPAVRHRSTTCAFSELHAVCFTAATLVRIKFRARSLRQRLADNTVRTFSASTRLASLAVALWTASLILAPRFRIFRGPDRTLCRVDSEATFSGAFLRAAPFSGLADFGRFDIRTGFEPARRTNCDNTQTAFAGRLDVCLYKQIKG